MSAPVAVRLAAGRRRGWRRAADLLAAAARDASSGASAGAAKRSPRRRPVRPHTPPRSARARRAQLKLELPLGADEAGLAAFAAAVSTPGSPEYGQYESSQ